MVGEYKSLSVSIYHMVWKRDFRKLNLNRFEGGVIVIQLLENPTKIKGPSEA